MPGQGTQNLIENVSVLPCVVLVKGRPTEELSNPVWIPSVCCFALRCWIRSPYFIGILIFILVESLFQWNLKKSGILMQYIPCYWFLENCVNNLEKAELFLLKFAISAQNQACIQLCRRKVIRRADTCHLHWIGHSSLGGIWYNIPVTQSCRWSSGFTLPCCNVQDDLAWIIKPNVSLVQFIFQCHHPIFWKELWPCDGFILMFTCD